MRAGASLHVCMTPHGPDTATFEGAIAKDGSVPEHLPDDTLAFMFEVGPHGCARNPAMRLRCSCPRYLRPASSGTWVILVWPDCDPGWPCQALEVLMSTFFERPAGSETEIG